MLSERLMTAAERVARVRGESVEQVQRRFTAEELKTCPARFSKHLPALRAARLERTGTRDGLAYVRLEDGLIFYSPLTHPGLRREYRFIADLLPGCITEETYLAAIDVVQRYITDYVWPPRGLVREQGARVIELGAYLGHKSIRFARELAAPDGKVLAVEMMPENCAILRRNVVENGLGHIIDVKAAGVWNEGGTRKIYSKGRQRNSIVPIEKLNDGKVVEVEVATLNDIVRDWGVVPVDLVLVTVNGAEIEVLEGFAPDAHDVRAFHVEAAYMRGDASSAQLCRERFKAMDYRLRNSDNPQQVFAVKAA